MLAQSLTSCVQPLTGIEPSRPASCGTRTVVTSSEPPCSSTLEPSTPMHTDQESTVPHNKALKQQVCIAGNFHREKGLFFFVFFASFHHLCTLSLVKIYSTEYFSNVKVYWAWQKFSKFLNCCTRGNGYTLFVSHELLTDTTIVCFFILDFSCKRC